MNAEMIRVVNTLQGEAFSFLGCDFRRVLHRRQQPDSLLTPRQNAWLTLTAESRQILRENGAQPVPAILQRLNPVLAGSTTAGWPIRTKPLVRSGMIKRCRCVGSCVTTMGDVLDLLRRFLDW